MSVVIEGVKVDNPTGVWMQLMNTRRRVLDRVEKWNDKGWYSGDAFRPTMCLANALRYVARGERGQPAAFSREQGDLEQAERVVMKAIVKVAHATYDDIPDFNDATYRQFDQIVRVLDEAIEMVAPYAKTFAISYADDVMTPEEKQEIQAAVRKAENEMWAEDRKRWGKHRDPNGIWRRADGRFASVPWWVRHGKETVTTTVPATWVPPKTTDQQQQQFKLWLDEHERRGWDTFWDELLECDKDDPNFEACQNAKKTLALGAKTPAAQRGAKSVRARQPVQ